MERFDNVTDNGNEKALRRGVRVPDGDVNLAWAKSPALSPGTNMVIVDTANTIEENIIAEADRCKLMYANYLGILQDVDGNQVINEQYPFIADVFSSDEDWDALPGNEYLDTNILPFRHISRFFHLDLAGLVVGDMTQTWEGENIKVIDSNGRDYVDKYGNKRYKIRLVAAQSSGGGGLSLLPQYSGYRVWVYVDSVENEELYLAYNKVEIQSDGTMINQDQLYTEFLNPQPYFEWIPEESDVVDPANRKKHWYSSKSSTLKNRILGSPIQSADGYKIYVPRKAVGDPRLFQLFRWRATCEFVEQITVDPSTSRQVIRACMATTNEGEDHSIPTTAPYLFYNMQISQFNATQIGFINPLKEDEEIEYEGETFLSPESKKYRDYWVQNFDEMSYEDLEKYDIIVFALPVNQSFQRLLGKIKYFTEDLGGTIFIDTNSSFVHSGLGINVTTPIHGSKYWPRSELGTSGEWARGITIEPDDYDHDIWNGDTTLGGWEFTDDEFGTISEYVSTPLGSEHYYNDDTGVHFISSFPKDYEVILDANNSNGSGDEPVLIRKETSTGGNIFFGCLNTIGSVAALLDPINTTRPSFNWWSKIWDPQEDSSEPWLQGQPVDEDRQYQDYTDNSVLEGAYKLFNNICLLAVAGKVIDDRDEQDFTTDWTVSSPWKASWVIDASDDVLSESEISRNEFVFLPRDIDPVSSNVSATPDQVWQRMLSVRTIKELIEIEMTEEDFIRAKGTTRTYTLEITNDLVDIPDELDPDDRPRAWTEAYTPKFTVPRDIGPNVVMEDPVVGEYEAGQFIHKDYPSKPWSVYINANYNASSEQLITEPAIIRATGTATETTTSKTPIKTTDAKLYWSTHGAKNYSGRRHAWNDFPQPSGMTTFQMENYKTTKWGDGQLNWPHWGLFWRGQQGSSGQIVMWLQDCLSRFSDLGVTYYGKISVDGRYGPQTAAAVRAFQITRQARFIDGVVDAETLWLLGGQIIRHKSRLPSPGPWANNHYKYYDWVQNGIKPQQASDRGTVNGVTKRSWLTGGPRWITDFWALKFPKTYKIYGVVVVPWLPYYGPQGTVAPLKTRTIRIDSIQIGNSKNPNPNSIYDKMAGWNPFESQLINQNIIAHDNRGRYIPVGPWNGDTVIVGISSTGGSGHGSSHVIGMRDFYAKAIATTGGETITVRKTVNLNYEKTISVTTDEEVTLNAVPDKTFKGKLSAIKWSNVTSSNSDVYVTITNTGRIKASHSQVTILNDTHHSQSDRIPPAPDENGFTGGEDLRSMNEHGDLNPGPELGWISKADGIKILCDSDKRPYGFPDMPTEVGQNEAQRHYTTLRLQPEGADPSVNIGFYDFSEQEFIFNRAGQPEMTYVEYATRGPENIYVGIYSTYEEESKRPLPVAADAPPIPFRWAMPVYGACARSDLRIGIEPLPPGLGPTDMWHVPIRTGKFDRLVKIPNRRDVPLTTNWQADYAGEIINAFYSVPESEINSWSDLYGRPYTDVKEEHPVVLSPNILRVKQAPVLMWLDPTVFPGAADPMRPIFTVYSRPDVLSAWEEVSKDDILDYNVSTGDIYLKNSLVSNDSNLVKVDYTTARRIYPFKGYGGAKLNLNPYPGHSRDLIGKAIYIYIVPEFVRNTENGRVITDSVQDRTLRFTTDSSIFNITDPAFDPLAIQIGVVYITTALDIDDLIILDSRRRGGGGKDDFNAQELRRLVQQAVGYWDIGHGAGMSYQKGGFVIVRLPRELENQFPDENEIIEIIERNITSGVKFKIEDLTGEDW